MSFTNDGGPAFPRTAYSDDFDTCKPQDGMSLRDYFAGQALAGLLAAGRDFQFSMNDMDDAANTCYMLADAMLEERGK